MCGGSTQQSSLITSTRTQMVKCAAGAGCSIIFGPGHGENWSSWHFLEHIHEFFFVGHLKFLHNLLWIIGFRIVKSWIQVVQSNLNRNVWDLVVWLAALFVSVCLFTLKVTIFSLQAINISVSFSL